jgi:hypothetical protein
LFLKKGYLLKIFLIIITIISCWNLVTTWQQYLNGKIVIADYSAIFSLEDDLDDDRDTSLNSEGVLPVDGINNEINGEIINGQEAVKQNKNRLDPEEIRIIKERNIFFPDNQKGDSPDNSDNGPEETPVEEVSEVSLPEVDTSPEAPLRDSSSTSTSDRSQKDNSQKDIKPLSNPFILLAVSAKETSPRAIILNKDTGLTYIIKPADIIEGYQVVGITQDKAILSRDEQQITVHFIDKGSY